MSKTSIATRLTAACLAMAASAAMAQSPAAPSAGPSPTPVPPRPSAPSKPDEAAFRRFFKPNMKRDQVKQAVAPVEAGLFAGGDVMTPETLAVAEKRFEAKVRAQRLATVMAADVDNDGKVDRAELEDFLKGRPGLSPDKVKVAVDQVFAMSKDGKAVTFDDLRQAPLPGVDANAEHRLGVVLLGSAKSLTKAQFDQAALDAFDAEDTNHDGTIELDEFLAGQGGQGAGQAVPAKPTPPAQAPVSPR